MKIIKEGSLPKKRIATCENCGCIIEFDVTEATEYYTSIDPLAGPTHYRIMCPMEFCRESIYVWK